MRVSWIPLPVFLITLVAFSEKQKSGNQNGRLTDALVNWCLGLRWFLNYGLRV